MLDTRAPCPRTRLAWVALLIGTLLPLTSGAARAGAPSDPPPVFDSNRDEKHFRAVVNFSDRETASLSEVEVSYGIARGRAGNPPLLRARVLDAKGNPLEEFNAWHPLWEFGWTGTEESMLVKSSGEGAFVFPFDPDAVELELVDVALDQQVVRDDLSGAVHAFCEENSEDPDCELADLFVEDVVVSSEPPLFLVGEPELLTVRTSVANAGPDGPIAALVTRSVAVSPGLSLTPAGDAEDEISLVAEAASTELDASYTLECVAAGHQTATFASRVVPVRAATVDPDPDNDENVLEVAVDCTIPVVINVEPGNSPNPVQLKSGTVPVAILSTAVGEYGLPLPFDASTIEWSTLRFGPQAGVAGAAMGAQERHARIHVEDALELDDLTRDGDADAMTHFRQRSSGLTSTDVDACVRGRTVDAAGSVGFFGCDEVIVRNAGSGR